MSRQSVYVGIDVACAKGRPLPLPVYPQAIARALLDGHVAYKATGKESDLDDSIWVSRTPRI